jgi:putative oxidoreductase
MNTSLHRLVRTNTRNFATLPLRLAVGAVMIGHGGQKLFGWWGGGGFDATAGFLSSSLGLEPGAFWAALVGGTEFFGGLALLLGLGTRLAAAGIAIAMAVATTAVHGGAFFLKDNGFEFAFTLMLAAVSLVIAGGGAFSVDSRLSARANP